MANFPYRNAIQGYNTGRPSAYDPLNTYDERVIEKRRAWTARLKEATDQ